MDLDQSWTKLAQLLGLSTGLVLLIVLSFLDIRKAFKKKEHWVPGQALVLSALTIQLITLFNAQSAALRENDFAPFKTGQAGSSIPITTQEQLLADSIKNDLLMIRIGRVMICVFVAYLLPGMARAASKNYRTRLVALLLTISFQSISEIFAINRNRSGVESVLYGGTGPGGASSFTLSTTTVLGSIVLLLLLLSCATIASKSIHDVMIQIIPTVLRDPDGSSHYSSWQWIEDRVLESWLTARVCHPEYVIARSVLIAAAGLIVTVCVIASIAGWAMEGAGRHFRSRFDWLRYTTMGLECLFILVGWTVVCWRWVTAVMFYGRRHGWKSHVLRVEDFWTRHILEQLDVHRTEIAEGDKKKKKRTTFVSRRKKIWLPRELLPALILLQTSVVIFSKACWIVSELLFCNSLFMRKFILDQWRGISTDPEYTKNCSILDAIALPGEKADGIWVANRAAIHMAKKLVSEGAANGKSCSTLISFLRSKTSPERSGAHCLSPGSYPSDLKFLCRVDPGQILQAEKSFLFARKRSWKMTAVNLLNILVRLSVLSPGSCNSPRRSKSVQDAMKAYSEAWELMDLVEESDPEAHILSEAADKVYRNLQLEIQFRYSWNPSSRVNSNSGSSMEDSIERLAKEGKAKADCHKLGHDSMDWKEVAAGNSLYKLCKSMDCSGAGGDVKVVMEEVVRSLADVMDCSMERVADSLVGNCRVWAKGFQEKKVLKCLYIGGKARAVMEELGRKPSKHARAISGHYHRDEEADEDDSIV